VCIVCTNVCTCKLSMTNQQKMQFSAEDVARALR
jgi:hypothetical protein